MDICCRRFFILPFTILLSGPAFPQTTTKNESPNAYVERLAVRSRSGDLKATTELTRQMFRNAAIPTDLADALGFTDRITKAERDHGKGEHSAVDEAAIVRAINNMVNEIGAPSWTKTNAAEVRKVRMHMLVNYPNFMANQDPPDSKGQYRA